MIIAIGLCLPLAGHAQSSPQANLAYCTRLSELYMQYLGHDEGSSSRNGMRGTLDGQVAVAKCRQGDPSGIPTLERLLRNQGFTLPRRS